MYSGDELYDDFVTIGRSFYEPAPPPHQELRPNKPKPTKPPFTLSERNSKQGNLTLRFKGDLDAFLTRLKRGGYHITHTSHDDYGSRTVRLREDGKTEQQGGCSILVRETGAVSVSGGNGYPQHALQLLRAICAEGKGGDARQK